MASKHLGLFHGSKSRGVLLSPYHWYRSVPASKHSDTTLAYSCGGLWIPRKRKRIVCRIDYAYATFQWTMPTPRWNAPALGGATPSLNGLRWKCSRLPEQGHSQPFERDGAILKFAELVTYNNLENWNTIKIRLVNYIAFHHHCNVKSNQIVIT